MCSGWATWGNSTRFGSGNSRAVPRKSSRGAGFWLMGVGGPWPVSLVLFGQVVVGVGPGPRLGLQPDLGHQGGGGAGAAVGRLGAEHRAEALLHPPPEARHVQPQEAVAQPGHVVAAGAVQLGGPAEVAVAEVAQPDGGLDEALVEAALGPVALRPQVLPDLVGLEEVLRVEQHDPRQVTRVVWLHARLLARPALYLYPSG